MGVSATGKMSSRKYGKIKSFIYSLSLLSGCVLFTSSLFLLSFSKAENDDYKIYFNIGDQLFQLTYKETGAASVEIQSGWDYSKADTSYQLPPVPKSLEGYSTPSYRYMVMYLNGKTCMTVYNGRWGRYYGDYNYTFYQGSHTWEFDSSKRKWIDAPANIQLPIPSKEY